MHVRYLMPLLCAVGATTATAAQDPWQAAEAQVDKSQWACKYCPYEEEAGLHGEVQLGVGYVSEDSFKFGDYTGLNRGGAYGIGDTALRYRGENAKYWNLYATNLGLDSRRVEMEGGHQGVYKAFLNYSELPKLLSDTAQTPFRGAGSDQLALPAGWVRTGTTDTMPLLNASLQNVDLRTDRTKLGIGLSFTPAQRWEYSARYTHERKEGLKDIGGGFLFRSTLLPEPVDYTTDQMELGVAYKADRWSTRLAYYGSFYRDDNQSLTFDDPFIAPVGNTTEGQLALPPDNEFHQVSLSGTYQFSDTTRASARLALGRMTQNDDFLPYTVNPNIATTALPRGSLDGKVDTTNFDARLTSTPAPRWHLQADLRFNERDNRTPQESYQYVLTDAFTPPSATNLTYSYRKWETKLSGRYRLSKVARLSAGAGYENYERPHQEVDKGRESSVWGEIRVHPAVSAQMSVRLTHAQRDGSYDQLATTVPSQNPLIRKYNMAQRTENRIGARLSMTPSERFSFGLSFDYTDDDYDDTEIGLTKSTNQSATVDAAFTPVEGLNLHAFISTEVSENKQNGSQNFTVPDWFATTTDTSNVAGFGGMIRSEFGEREFGFDYTYSHSRGETEQRGQTQFPDLVARLQSFKAYGRYHTNESLAVELAYYYEKYDGDNWMLDGVEPATVAELLALGEESPSYSVDVVMASLRYSF